MPPEFRSSPPALTWLLTSSSGVGFGRWEQAASLASFVFLRTAVRLWRNRFIVISLAVYQPLGLGGFFRASAADALPERASLPRREVEQTGEEKSCSAPLLPLIAITAGKGQT